MGVDLTGEGYSPYGTDDKVDKIVFFSSVFQFDSSVLQLHIIV